MEQTVVLVKPDGVKRGLIGEVIHRIERMGLKLVGLKMVWPSEELFHQHYGTQKESTIYVWEIRLWQPTKNTVKMPKKILVPMIQKNSVKWLSAG